MLVVPALGEIWRPFCAYGAMSLAVLLAGAIATLFGETIAAGVAVFVTFVCLLLAVVRALTWRLLPGRVSMVCDEVAIRFVRGGRTVRTCRWSEISQLLVFPGDRWPEWSTWAGFSTVQCITGTWPNRGSVRPPGMLLVRNEQIEQAQRNLDAAARRYAPQALDSRGASAAQCVAGEQHAVLGEQLEQLGPSGDG